MEVGDTVMHPRYGVGTIGGIEMRLQDGEQREYYVIPKPSISSTIFVPVDSAEEVGLRLISEPDTLEEAVEILGGRDGEDVGMANLKNLTWGDPLDLARAIRHQLTEPKSRYPKVSEQHQLRRAKKLLAEELSAVLGLTEDTIAALVDGTPATDSKRAVG